MDILTQLLLGIGAFALIVVVGSVRWDNDGRD